MLNAVELALVQFAEGIEVKKLIWQGMRALNFKILLELPGW
jgi:hypothetical protein